MPEETESGAGERQQSQVVRISGESPSGADGGTAIAKWLRPDAPAKVIKLAAELEKAFGEASIVAASYQGPLPPASEFARYESAVQGAGDRILKLAENEQQLYGTAWKIVYRTNNLRIIAASVVSVGLLGVSAYGFLSVLPRKLFRSV